MVGTTAKTAPDTFTLTVPKADVNFFKTMAKKMGWVIERKRTAKPRLYDPETGEYMNDRAVRDIEQALDDAKHGRLTTYNSVDEFFKEMGL